MDSHDQKHNKDPQHLGTNQGEDEDHHEKKSVFKKVKDKAKKIKDTFKKQGRGRDHQEGQIPDDHDLDEDNDEEDEDTEMNGATTIRSSVPEQGDILKVPLVKFGDTKAMHDDPVGSNLERKDAKISGHEEISGQPKVNFGRTSEMGGGLHGPRSTPVSSLGEYKSKVTDPNHTVAHEEEGHLGQSRVDTTPVSSLGEYKSEVTDPSQTFASGNEGHLGQSRVNLDPPRGLEADPHLRAYTPSNNQNKVTDPTNAGGEEVVTPILHSLDKMNIRDGTEQSSYTDKNSSAASPIADKAISAENVVVSKLGYGGNNDQHGDIKPQACTASTNAGGGDEQKPHKNLSTDQFSAAERPSNQSSTYTEKTSSATSAIADKEISAKNVVASTLGYGGNNDDDDDHHEEVTAKPGGPTAPEQDDKGVSQSKAVQDKGASVKDYFAEKLKPGEEDRALSEVMSEALRKPKAEDSARPVGEVTESEEVTRNLGPDSGIERVEQSSYGKIVSDTVKGAFGSLFGKADENPSSQQPIGSSTGGTDGFSNSESGAAEHPSLQGSGN